MRRHTALLVRLNLDMRSHLAASSRHLSTAVIGYSSATQELQGNTVPPLEMAKVVNVDYPTNRSRERLFPRPEKFLRLGTN